LAKQAYIIIYHHHYHYHYLIQILKFRSYVKRYAVYVNIYRTLDKGAHGKSYWPNGLIIIIIYRYYPVLLYFRSLSYAYCSVRAMLSAVQLPHTWANNAGLKKTTLFLPSNVNSYTMPMHSSLPPE
jgi:hypothetical protein